MTVFNINKSIVKLNKITHCWFLTHAQSHSLFKTINMDQDEFNNVMMFDFKGFEWDQYKFLFYTEADAQSALEWIESQYLSVILAK